ncbi:disulfide bond formation protein B [Sphingopyxis sp.]|jgi:disulfide bond formation protein DsbB|uniref:disulfide bond formation protein B n=1 Tax=Sphingopyxis sp. TaxID=1908224 RepID=UPI002DF97C0D|nr:disulfide bond formation protein B [Sphingopyxis sp.]
MTSFPLLAPHKWRPLGAAWAIALVSSLAVLFVGEVMGQAPCDLCWFQRAFMFPLAIILGVAAFKSDCAVVPYGLALAAGGSLVALYHSLLYVGIIPAPIVPCTGGPSCSGESMAVGGVPLPLLSLAAFALIITLLLNFQRRLKS